MPANNITEAINNQIERKKLDRDGQLKSQKNDSYTVHKIWDPDKERYYSIEYFFSGRSPQKKEKKGIKPGGKTGYKPVEL